MENERNVTFIPKAPKKHKVARVFLALAASLALTIISLTMFVVTPISYGGTDFATVVHDLIYDLLPLPIFIFFLTAVVSIIQSVIGKKIGASIPEILLPCAILLVLSGALMAMDKDAFHLIATSVLVIAFRCLLLIVDMLMRKKAKLIPICVACALALSVMSPVLLSLEDDFLLGEGEPDKLGSWSAINQTISRGKDWKQIVTDSDFQLGSNDMGTYPALDGSTVCVPMAIEFARQHLGMKDKEAEEFVYFNTTHYAYEALICQDKSEYAYIFYAEDDYYPPNLILATEPSYEELIMAKARGIELIKKPICYDAFVFITHKDNPVDSLTVQQIRDIYSGKITNWKEVGGNDEQIKAYQREANSGSQTAMENLVMGGVGMIDPITVPVIAGMGGLVDTVAEYDNKTCSIGYTYKYYIDTLYKNDNIKTIAIEGIEPTDENIRSEAYPFSTNYYGVIRGGEEENTGGKFLDWILSEEGQRCIKQAGYVTIMEIE